MAKQTSIVFDGKKFSIRIEYTSIIEHIDLPGEVFLQDAVSSADRMGHYATHWYNYLGEKIQLPKNIVRMKSVHMILAAQEAGLPITNISLSQIKAKDLCGIPFDAEQARELALKICAENGWDFYTLNDDNTAFNYAIPGLMSGELWFTFKDWS